MKRTAPNSTDFDEPLALRPPAGRAFSDQKLDRLIFCGELPDPDELAENPGWEPEPLKRAAQQLLNELLAKREETLGRAAFAELTTRLRGGFRHAQRLVRQHGGGSVALSAELEVKARTELRWFGWKYPAAQLRRELDDQRWRARAAGSESELLKYLARWRARVSSLQRGFRSAWRVVGFSEDELVDEVEVLLLEQVRGAQKEGRPILLGYEAPGLEATFAFVARAKDALRRRQRFYVTTRKPSGDELYERVRTPEEEVAIVEGRAAAARVLERMEKRLSRLQRRWYNVFCSDFEDVEQAPTKLRLQNAATQLGRHRSSAVRVRDVMRTRLLESGALELLEEVLAQRCRRRNAREDGAAGVGHAEALKVSLARIGCSTGRGRGG